MYTIRRISGGYGRYYRLVSLKVPVHTAIDISFVNMKHKDPVWSNCEVLDSENSKEQKAKCLNCSAVVSAQAPRLKSHLQKC